MKCERCNTEHTGAYGSGRFCSRICSNSRGPRTDDFKRKVSEKLKGKILGPRGPLSEETKNKISISLIGKASGRKQVFTDKEVFIANSNYPRRCIKKRILQNKILEYRCSLCNIDDNWNNNKLTLQLDHINGINNDHRLSNLRFLCPNCHSQQETYAGKNKGRFVGVV